MIEAKIYPGNLVSYRDGWQIASYDISRDALMLWCPPSIYPDSPFASCGEAVADFMSDVLDDPKFDLDPPLTDDEKQTLCADIAFAVGGSLNDWWTEWEEATE